MDVQNRKLCLYDDKRILIANLHNGWPKSDIYALKHYSLEAVQCIEPEQQPAKKNVNYFNLTESN